MQPLKILAFVIGALPITAFLLTLYLTEGAPLQPFSRGEESGLAAATQALPQVKRERQGSVVAAGHRSAGAGIGEDAGAGTASAPNGDPAAAHMVNREQDAKAFMTLFGGPRQDRPPPP